jgi:hypothetical protein
MSCGTISGGHTHREWLLPACPAAPASLVPLTYSVPIAAHLVVPRSVRSAHFQNLRKGKRSRGPLLLRFMLLLALRPDAVQIETGAGASLVILVPLSLSLVPWL